jgi:hypothetical protein
MDGGVFALAIPGGSERERIVGRHARNSSNPGVNGSSTDSLARGSMLEPLRWPNRVSSGLEPTGLVNV